MITKYTFPIIPLIHPEGEAYNMILLKFARDSLINVGITIGTYYAYEYVKEHYYDEVMGESKTPHEEL